MSDTGKSRDGRYYQTEALDALNNIEQFECSEDA